MSFQEDLLRPDAWSGLVMGNHALARAMLEAGVQVITTYPGSPTPEIAAALNGIRKEDRPFYFEYSTNEKVALEVAAGASLNGRLSTCFFKSVGLNVALDSLIQLPMMEMIGGMVVVLGDDPGVNSSQNEQDNRHIPRMSYTPLFEPATPQETCDMFHEACALAKKHQSLVMLRLTTHVCHAKQVVQFGPLKETQLSWEPRFAMENGPYVPIGQTCFPLKKKALEKLEAYRAYSETSASHRQVPSEQPAQSRLGVISASLPALSVMENLEAHPGEIDLLKLGMTHPLPKQLILNFLNQHEEVLVIEELDRVLEIEIKALAYDAKTTCRILSRSDLQDLQGELGPHQTAKLLAQAWPERFRSTQPRALDLTVAQRLPQLCPGCGHRSAFYAVKKAMQPDTITVADIGCHSMGFLWPHHMGQVLFSMGHSTSTAAGLALGGHARKVIAFLGDSTLFHAGLPGLINAIDKDHNLTLVVLDNGTTAMTGHQPRVGSGELGQRIALVDLFQTLGVKFIRDVDAYAQAKLIEALGEAMQHSGFAVVIARHPCMLKFTRTQRAKNPQLKLPHVEVDQNLCDLQRECIERFGCPSFVNHEDGRVRINPELCIGDGSCIQTCPKQALGRSNREAAQK